LLFFVFFNEISQQNSAIYLISGAVCRTVLVAFFDKKIKFRSMIYGIELDNDLSL